MGFGVCGLASGAFGGLGVEGLGLGFGVWGLVRGRDRSGFGI